MEATVLYKEFSKALDNAKRVGLNSTKDPAVRQDCIVLETVRIGPDEQTYLRVGGGSTLSYCTHIPATSVSGLLEWPRFFKNEWVATIKSMGFKADDWVYLETSADETQLVVGGVGSFVGISIPLETTKVHTPTLRGDEVPGYEDIPWDNDTNPYAIINSKAVRWATLPDAHAFHFALKNFKAAMNGIYAAADLPHKAEVLRIMTSDAPFDLQEYWGMNNKSGVALRFLATDQKAVAEAFTPIVRRKDHEPLKVFAIGMADTDLETLYNIPLILQMKHTKLLAQLIDPDLPTALRVTLGTEDPDNPAPYMLYITNGPSLISVPLDKSGLYQENQGILDYLAINAPGAYKGSIVLDASFVKGVKQIAKVRGADDHGVKVTLSSDGIEVATPEGSPSTLVITTADSWATFPFLRTEYPGSARTVHLEAKRFAAIVAACSKMAVHIRMSPSHISLESDIFRFVLQVLD
jgi:hypothetical protein